MAKLTLGTKLLNYAHKATILVLFGVTMSGAYICSDFGYKVMKKRYTPPLAVSEVSAQGEKS